LSTIPGDPPPPIRGVAAFSNIHPLQKDGYSWEAPAARDHIAALILKPKNGF